MSEVPNFDEWRVQNSEQAIRLIREQLGRVALRHDLTFVPIPDASDQTKKDQRKQYTLLMMEYGIVVGLTEMAHKAGFLEDNAYRQLKEEAVKLTMPGVVGVVQNFGSLR